MTKETVVAETVVVGIDGSTDSSAALRWALDYAGQRAAKVRVVHVWTPVPWYEELPLYRQNELALDRARSAEQAAKRTAETLRALTTVPAGVEASVIEGAPGAALVDVSRDAALLVVGATGRGGAEGSNTSRVGATARYVTRHAVCPVTVVSHDRHPASSGVLHYRNLPVSLAVPAAVMS